MIELEMYINDELIDVVKFGTKVLPRKYQSQLKTLICQMKKKHIAKLSKSETEPVFVLTGVPSEMNDFVPLNPSQLTRGTNAFATHPLLPSISSELLPVNETSAEMQTES